MFVFNIVLTLYIKIILVIKLMELHVYQVE